MKRIYLFLYARVLLGYFFVLTISLLLGLLLLGLVAPDSAMELWCRFCTRFYAPAPPPVVPEQPNKALLKIEICPN